VVRAPVAAGFPEVGKAAREVHVHENAPETLPKHEIDETVGGEIAVEQDLEHSLQNVVRVRRQFVGHRVLQHTKKRNMWKQDNE
jgi:hypothetical protein